MGRDALQGGVLRAVADHRSQEGRRVGAYMRSLVEPFIPTPWPWAKQADDPTPTTRPPASVREQARMAGRLLLEEESLLSALADLRGRPKKARDLRRVERRVLGVRGMRIKIEKLLQEKARRR